MAKKKKTARRLTKKMRGNLFIVFIGILCLFLVLMGRLIYWTVRDGDKFKTIVLGQQNHASTDIAYERGKIYDRNGNILAANEKIYTLVLEPKNILENNLDKRSEDGITVFEATVDALVTHFGFDKEDLEDTIKKNKDSYYLVYKKELNFDDVEKFNKFLEKAELSTTENTSAKEAADIVQAKHVSGVVFEEGYKRVYPYNTLACRILGFTSAGNQGNWGIEQYYNNTLNGTNGRAYYYFNEELSQEKSIKEAKNGNSVVSTIDMQIQQIIEEKLADFDKNIGSKMTSILVMDPRDGSVLGMASSNPYNLNDPMDEKKLLSLYSQKEIDDMKEYTKVWEEEQRKKEAEEKEEAAGTEEEDISVEAVKEQADKSAEASTEEKTEEKEEEKEEKETIYDGFYNLWRNVIISDTKEPGSTYKPFTVATGLENGILTGNEEYYCTGSLTVGKRNIGCSHVHGNIDLKHAVAKSCNVSMMNIAFNEGEELFYQYQNLFGFGRKTGIDLPGEAETSKLVYNASTYENSAALATNAFGQNFNCSMMQMAAGFCSLINGGHYYQPRVVKQIQNDKGDVVEEKEKILLRNTISEETSETLRSYLRETVESGTGTKAKIPGYTLGGKTGTAEKYPRNKEDYYISFIGYAPADEPEVLIYVTIDEPNVDNQANAGLAVNLQRECMEEILPVLGIEPTEEITQQDLDLYETVTGQKWE